MILAGESLPDFPMTENSKGEKHKKINDDDIITYTVIAYIVNGIK